MQPTSGTLRRRHPAGSRPLDEPIFIAIVVAKLQETLNELSTAGTLIVMFLDSSAAQLYNHHVAILCNSATVIRQQTSPVRIPGSVASQIMFETNGISHVHFCVRAPIVTWDRPTCLVGPSQLSRGTAPIVSWDRPNCHVGIQNA